MRKFGICLLLAGASVWSTGCGMQFGGASASAKGGLAIVDLDRVGAETGKALEMKEAFDQQENAWKQLLANAQASANTQLQAKAKELELTDESSDETKRQFAQMRVNAANQLTQAQNVAGNKLTQFRQEQIAKFRVELKPFLQEAAAKRGLGSVIPKNDGLLLAVNPGVDITDDVIREFSKKRTAAPAAAPVAAPAPAAAAATAAKPATKPAAPRSASKEVDRETEDR